MADSFNKHVTHANIGRAAVGLVLGMFAWFQMTQFDRMQRIETDLVDVRIEYVKLIKHERDIANIKTEIREQYREILDEMRLLRQALLSQDN